MTQTTHRDCCFVFNPKRILNAVIGRRAKMTERCKEFIRQNPSATIDDVPGKIFRFWQRNVLSGSAYENLICYKKQPELLVFLIQQYYKVNYGVNLQFVDDDLYFRMRKNETEYLRIPSPTDFWKERLKKGDTVYCMLLELPDYFTSIKIHLYGISRYCKRFWQLRPHGETPFHNLHEESSFRHRCHTFVLSGNNYNLIKCKSEIAVP